MFQKMNSINFDLTLPSTSMARLDIDCKTSEYGSCDNSFDNEKLVSVGGIGQSLIFDGKFLILSKHTQILIFYLETTVITYDRNKIHFWHGSELLNVQQLTKTVRHIAFGRCGNLTIGK